MFVSNARYSQQIPIFCALISSHAKTRHIVRENAHMALLHVVNGAQDLFAGFKSLRGFGIITKLATLMDFAILWQ